MNRLIKLADDAAYKPHFIIASLLSLGFVILGSSFTLLGLFVDVPDYLSLAIFDLSIGFGAISILCFLYVRAIERRPIYSMGFEKDKWLKKYGRGFGLGIGLFTLAVIVGYLTGAFEVSLSISSANGFAIIAILFGFLIQGATEEIIYRGWLLPIVSARYTPVFGVILSSLLFAFLHGGNPGITILPIINLILFGLFAAVYALKEESLWGICGFHSAWNWVQGSVFGIKVSGTTVPGGSILTSSPTQGMDLISGGAFGIEGSIVCTLIFLIPTIILVLKLKKKQ